MVRFEKPLALDLPAAVRVENISKSFGHFQALQDVSFEIRQGEVLGFLGPNGAGKTTAMRILTGFFPPSQGKVWVSGMELFKNPHKTKSRIGYLPESVSIYPDMDVEEFLKFVGSLKGLRKAVLKNHLEKNIERCGLSEVRKRLIGNLSKGYRQRVGLAQAIMGDPDLIVLDEPTNGLDPKQIIEIRNLIKELGRKQTLILSSHILPEISAVCDRVLIMNKGRIMASGTSEELEAGLKKAMEVSVLIAGARHKEKALELLSHLPGVEKIQVKDEREDQVGFTLMVPQEGPDPRIQISKFFVENQIPLLELRSGRLSLEEIFMKIVLNDTPLEGVDLR